MKQIIHIIITLTLITLALNKTHAQRQNIAYDTAYIKSNRSDFVISLITKLNYHKMLLENNIVNKISYSTNSPYHHGLSIDYKWLTLEYSTSFDKYAAQDRGKTKSHYFSFGYTGRKLWFTNYWHRNTGYNLKIKNISTDLVDREFRSDISTKIYHASLKYGFNNKKYSNIATLWQLELQKKSAGSFSAGISYTKTSLKNNRSIIPNDKIIIFKEIAQYKKLTTYHFETNIGYIHTFLPFKSNKVFISFAAMPGISFQKNKVENFEDSLIANKNRLGYDLQTIISTGYNNNNWFVSLRYTSYKFFYIISNDNKLSDNYSFFRLAFGLKLKTKKTKFKFLRLIGL